MIKHVFFLTILLFAALAAACVAPAPLVVPGPAADDATGAISPDPSATPAVAARRGPGAGMGGSMMARHHAVVPEPYAGQSNPIAADEESLARGQELYTANCASCHGETGMGEGPAGQALDPPVAPIAHTGQMLSDAYLFWRISEGGALFGTAMPAWADVLDEQARWDLVNYVRSLEDIDSRGFGPGPIGPEEAEHRAEMLAEAVTLGVITQAEADLFESVHAVLDEVYGADEAGMEGMGPRGMQVMQRAMTDQAVRDGQISQADADRFSEIHDRLIEAGVMH